MNTIEDTILDVLPFGLLTPADVARELDTTVEALADLRQAGKGPAYIAVVGDVVRYNAEVIAAYKQAWADLENLDLVDAF